NDKDGRTDEEAFDGVDNDGDGETNSPVSQHVPVRGQAMADGLDNDINGLVDEGIDDDIFFPRVMINFQSLLDSGSGADLVEIGYAIDVRTGRDLLRRSAYRDLNNQRQGLPQVNGQNEVDGIYPISLQYNLGEEVPYPGVGDSNGAKVPWFDPENPQSGVTLDGSNLSIPGAPDQTLITQTVEPMALHIVGFDCKVYFYNYLIAEAKNVPSGRVAAQFREARNYHPYSFPALSWDSSIENTLSGSIGFEIAPSFLPNGANDMAVVAGSEKAESFAGQPFAAQRIFESLAENTDGLPRLVEVTLFVQDENRYRDDPVKVSTRVFLPFETGDE
ncbi:MAG: hypothetical protein KC931_25240, partial [Candidatus Omnitrophica bacterium]|nr:hypothetical protein [Candidatus Omnitrophota bacterium]